MPHVEQFMYGSEGGRRGDRRWMLAASAGLGKDVNAEIRRLCDNWGDLPAAGLAAPALLCAPLRATLTAMRGQLWAIMRMAPGDAAFVHGVVMTDADFAGFGRNPYAVARQISFADAWHRGLVLGRLTVQADPEARLVAPLPSAADRVLVTEAIRHILTTGSLLLPLEQPGAEADRALALIIASLPVPLRRELRFASWAGKDGNAYGVAALSVPEASCDGWPRLLMAEVAPVVPEPVENYARKVGGLISAGDLDGLCRLGREQTTTPAAQVLVPGRSVLGEASNPGTPLAPATVPPDSEETARAGTEQSAIREHNSAPVGLERGRVAGSDQVGAIHPARRGSQRSTAWVADEARGTEAPPRPAERKRVVRAGRIVDAPRRHATDARRLAVFVAGGLLVATVGWLRMPQISTFVAHRIEAIRLRGDGRGSGSAATLLRVVDVGEIYARKLSALTRADLGLPGAGNDQRKVQLDFQSEAAGPLLEQIDLFAELAAEGIQQGGRPDREIDRLDSLAGQGRVLEHEMRRLELAWFSLANDIKWRDLRDLGDEAVIARRDSLKRAAPTALAAASRAVGTAPAWGRLRVARRQVAGMAALLDAYQVSEWSEGWEERLYEAAERVSPTASDATRAYRNCAFALVRLKRAERLAAARDLPFADEFGDGVWPSPEVRDVLADLRRQASRFYGDAVPSVLTGTLDLYAALEKAGTLARDAAGGDTLAELSLNPAVTFDPVAYVDYLERIRFEAARTALDVLDDPAGIPRHLYSGQDSLMAYRFYTALSDSNGSASWSDETRRQDNPFLARWAQHKADRILAADVERRATFDRDWQDCLELAARIRTDANEGRDWTQGWLELRRKSVGLLDTNVRLAGGDRELGRRLTKSADLVRAMNEPRGLDLRAVTVRLGPDGLAGPDHVVVELLTTGHPDALHSGPVVMGAAAPAGSGWVGTADLRWLVNVAPSDDLTVRVLDAAGNQLFAVGYDSLIGGGGPGALTRPRGPGLGTVTFRLDPSWWRNLELPTLQ